MATNNLLKHHYVIYCSILCISQLKGRTLRNAASLANFSVKFLTEMAPAHLQYQCPCPCKREHETCITSPPFQVLFPSSLPTLTRVSFDSFLWILCGHTSSSDCSHSDTSLASATRPCHPSSAWSSWFSTLSAVQMLLVGRIPGTWTHETATLPQCSGMVEDGLCSVIRQKWIYKWI